MMEEDGKEVVDVIKYNNYCDILCHTSYYNDDCTVSFSLPLNEINNNPHTQFQTVPNIHQDQQKRR